MLSLDVLDIGNTNLLPQLLEESLSLLRRVVESVLLSKVVTKPSKSRHPVPVQLRTSLLVLILLFLRELALPHGQAKVRSPLEHSDRRSVLSRLLRNLDTSRASSDDSDLLALGRNTTFRPERGVVHLALERIQALPVGEVALCGETDGVDEVLCVCCAAVLGLDVPLVCFHVELGTDDSGVESGVFLDLQLLFNVLEVRAQLLPVRVFLCPCPVLIEALVDVTRR
jgi:hypothetical protein